MRAKLLNFGLGVTLAVFGFPFAAGAQPLAMEQRVDRYLQPYLDIGHLSGTLLIARDDEVVYEKSFGLADREHGVANTPRTKFGVGSVNKPMTIVVLARLVEMEMLALDDKLIEYLPDFPRADEITVGDLLNHSAGIPHRVTEPLDETRPQTPASMVGLAARKDLVFEPGSDSVYSSAGFSVLARVLELAGGKPYTELLAEHVLRPAGMADTSDSGTRAILEHRAESYYFSSDAFVNAPPSDISYLVGAGSVFSTPRDLLAMQQALLAGRLGKGAQKLLVRDSGNLSWNGLANGYRAFADYDAASGVSVVVASNLTSGALDKIRSALPRIAAGEDVPTPEPIRAEAADVDTEILEGYQGAYELRPGRNLELRVVDGSVMMEEWLLIPTSERTLFSPQDYAEIEVVLDEEGGVDRLDWTIGGQTYPLPKVTPSHSKDSDSPAGAIDSFIAPFVELAMFDGNVLVDVGGEIRYERSFGFANYENGVRNAADTKFRIASVSDRNYSNGGYAVAAKVLEIAGEGSFAAVMRDLVFEPLGMSDTGHIADARFPIPKMSTGYEPGPRPGEHRHARFYAVETRPGGGSLYSTARDLLRFARGVFREGFLEASLVESVLGADDGTFLAQGRSPGFVAKLLYDPTRDVIVVSLANSYAVPADWAATIADLATGEAKGASWPAIQRSAETVAESDTRLGRYRNSRGGGELSVKRNTEGEMSLRDLSSGAVTGLVLLADGAFLMPLYFQRCEQAVETRSISCRILSGDPRYTTEWTPVDEKLE